MSDTLKAVRDPRRLAALEESGLLDTEVEEQFDRLTRLASRLLGTPATFFSLVDEDRDFYKSCVGFPEPLASERQLTGTTFCHYSLVADGALVIPDTRADPVYRNVPTVETLGVAAYLGVPVHAPGGAVLGSFCAIDMKPRDWTPLDIDIMKELAKSAEREVAIRHWLRSQALVVEREREAHEELQRVVESRGRLMRGFTHDVKNPIGAADGLLALLEEEILGPLAEAQKETVMRSRRALGNALVLIDELVQIARSDEEEVPVKRVLFDPVELVDEMIESLRPQADAKGLGLEFSATERLPPLSSDPLRVRQIVDNLIGNAIKYTNDGRIDVRVYTSVVEPEDQASVVIAVSDTGPGIAEADVPRVFEEFTRLDPSAARGAGLGLAISDRLSTALGGRLTVQSHLGKGSTFALWLPAEADGE